MTQESGHYKVRLTKDSDALLRRWRWSVEFWRYGTSFTNNVDCGFSLTREIARSAAERALRKDARRRENKRNAIVWRVPL